MYSAIATHSAQHDLPGDIRLVLWGDNALTVFQQELDAAA